jgi:DmsE family decaheme c-type cytochrome
MADRRRLNWSRVLGNWSGIALFLASALAFVDQPALAQAAPGPEVCQNCHADSVASYQASIHGKKGHPKTPANAGGCVACHANAAEHVKAGGGRGAGGIVNPSPRNKAISAEAKSNICLGCHSDNRHLAFWDSGRHRKNEVACTNCHNTHGGNPSLLRVENPPISPYVRTSQVPQQEVCFTCHRDIRALVLRPSHHPIQEGKVKCTSCHNPHGALSHAMINEESVRQLCITCHGDKRGPYMFEHPPVEENCLNCHNPHGSRSAKLLKQKVPNLCQDCHDAAQHPGTAYDPPDSFLGATPNTRFVARSCMNCHNEIHGSNSPNSRGRRFVR